MFSIRWILLQNEKQEYLKPTQPHQNFNIGDAYIRYLNFSTRTLIRLHILPLVFTRTIYTVQDFLFQKAQEKKEEWSTVICIGLLYVLCLLWYFVCTLTELHSYKCLSCRGLRSDNCEHLLTKYCVYLQNKNKKHLQSAFYSIALVAFVCAYILKNFGTAII